MLQAGGLAVGPIVRGRRRPTAASTAAATAAAVGRGSSPAAASLGAGNGGSVARLGPHVRLDGALLRCCAAGRSRRHGHGHAGASHSCNHRNKTTIYFRIVGCYVYTLYTCLRLFIFVQKLVKFLYKIRTSND